MATMARAEVEARASEHAVVEGADLPLKMPIASLADMPQLADQPQLLVNFGNRAPTLLETYTAPIGLANRDFALIGAKPTGAEQVAPLLLPLIAQLLLDERPAPPASALSASSSPTKGACRPRGLVLTPTRSLATFAARLARELAAGTRLGVARACGGVTIDASVAECAAGSGTGDDALLLVATPGRLLDLLDRGAVALSAVRHLMIVGVDAHFDLGHADHLRRCVVDEGLPPLAERQSCLSCASMPPAVSRVVPHLLRPSHVKLTAPKPWLAAVAAPLACRQSVRWTDERTRQPALTSALVNPTGAYATEATAVAPAPPDDGAPHTGLALVVVASRRHSEMVLYFLQGEGFAVAALPHDRPKRAEKMATLSAFIAGTTRVLIVTDAVLRAFGEELPPVGHVVSFDFPPSMEEYTLRLAHTACGGHTGRMTTFVTDATPREQIIALVEALQSSGNEVPRWLEGMTLASHADGAAPVVVQ